MYLIDVDLGYGATGVSNVESALQLVNVFLRCRKGISYRGIQAYSDGVQHIKDLAERDHVYIRTVSLPLRVDCRAR